jgi:hypothetical protein
VHGLNGHGPNGSVAALPAGSDGSLTDPERHNQHVTKTKKTTQRPISKWVVEDGYNLASFDQTIGAWQLQHPLPLPQWMPRSKDALVVDTIWQYEDIIGVIDTLLQRMLEETHYDTVHNFLDLHQSYRRSDNAKSLRKFFQKYQPPINRRHHMCVSLGMEIIARISDIYPEIADRFYLVSCEEALDDHLTYVEACEEDGIERIAYNLEKEHALVAMKVNVAGRDGILLLDPGYHVARAVTIMQDQAYPNTGWFTQTDEPACKREYCYSFAALSTKFVQWQERSTRGDKEKLETSLVFVDKSYMTAIDVTVRRNLVYNFRSLLARDAKGRVCAGLYFPIPASPSDTHITLFYLANEQSVKVKQRLSVFIDPSRLPNSLQHHLECLAPQLRFELDDLVVLLQQCATALADFDFVKQLLLINSQIGELSVDTYT